MAFAIIKLTYYLVLTIKFCVRKMTIIIYFRVCLSKLIQTEVPAIRSCLLRCQTSGLQARTDSRWWTMRLMYNASRPAACLILFALLTTTSATYIPWNGGRGPVADASSIPDQKSNSVGHETSSVERRRHKTVFRNDAVRICILKSEASVCATVSTQSAIAAAF